MIATLGAAFGLAVAWVGIRGLLALAPPGTPLLERVGLGWRSLAFAWVVVVVVATLTGLVPALQLLSRDLVARLGRGAGDGGGLGATRLRSVEERTAYLQDVARRVHALPGVRRAALTNAVPMRNLGPTFCASSRP